MEGPESVRAIIEQLEGFEAPAAAWEGEMLPARLLEYDPHVARRSLFVGRSCLGASDAACTDASN